MYLFLRVLGGQDVPAAEIRSLPDKTWATLAAVLSQIKGDRAQKEATLRNLLVRAGIDAGRVLLALLGVDPSRPPEAWSPPIEPELPAAGAFPLARLSRVVQRFVRVAAASIGCPVDFPALAALVVPGAALGNSCRLRLKPGWRVSTCIYGVPVGEPSDGKSPAMDAAVEPFGAVQHEMMDAYDIAIEQWKDECAAAKQAKAPLPDRPLPGRVLTKSFTGEGLIRRLVQAPRGLLCAVDEISGLIGGLNQYRGGRGEDRERLMSIWKHVSIVTDRASSGDGIPVIYAYHPFLGILGGINTANLPLFFGPGRLNVGYFDRHVFAYPEPVPKPDWDFTGLPDEICKEWDKLIRKLIDRPMERDEHGKLSPYLYQLDERGKEAWVDHYNQHAREMRARDFPAELRGPWGKLEEYAGRFALNLALVEYVATTPESEYLANGTRNEVCGFKWDQAVVGAWSLVDDYFKHQTKRVLAKIEALTPAPAGANESRAIQAVTQWIQSNRRTSFQAKELEDLRIFRGEPRLRDQTLQEMVRRGHIRHLPEVAGQGSGKRSSPTYEVNGRLRTWEASPPTDPAENNRHKIASKIARDRHTPNDPTPSGERISGDEPGNNRQNRQNRQSLEGTFDRQPPEALEPGDPPLPEGDIHISIDSISQEDTRSTDVDVHFPTPLGDPPPEEGTKPPSGIPSSPSTEYPVRLPISTLPEDLLFSSSTPGDFGDFGDYSLDSCPIAVPNPPCEGELGRPVPPAPVESAGDFAGDFVAIILPPAPRAPSDPNPDIPDQLNQEAGKPPDEVSPDPLGGGKERVGDP
jgi:hypothetical protein